MSRHHAFDISLPLESPYLEVRVTGAATPYDSGRTSGPPEDRYPPEGGEVEIDEVWLVHGQTKEPLQIEISPLLLLLGDTASARMQELVEEALANREPDEPDYSNYED